MGYIKPCIRQGQLARAGRHKYPFRIRLPTVWVTHLYWVRVNSKDPLQEFRSMERIYGVAVGDFCLMWMRTEHLHLKFN